MSELIAMTLAEARDAIRAKKISSKELTGAFVKLANRVDGVLTVRIVFDGALVVLDSLLGLRQRRFRPQSTELLVNPGHVRAQLGVVLRHRRECLGPAFQ